MPRRAKLRMAKADVARAVTVLERHDVFGPWLNAESAAAYLDFSNCKDPVGAFRKWVRRVDPPLSIAHRGDVPLYYRDDLDRAINASLAHEETR